MVNMGDKVCPNHPEVAAVTRCVACFKPLCTECIYKAGGQDFCSETCAKNHFTTDKSITEFRAAEEKRKLRKRIKKIIMLFILAAIAFAVYRYWRNNQSRVDQVSNQLKEKSRQLQKSIK